MTRYVETNGLQVADIDAWVSSDDVFEMAPAEVRRRRAMEIDASISHHRSVSKDFDEYCRRLRIDENTTEISVRNLPLFPSSLFKSGPDLVRVPTTDGIVTTSSGTQGSVSKVLRDDDTMTRFFGSITASVQTLLGIEDSETRVYSLGPRVEETQHLWISYVMSGVALLHDTEFYVSQGVLELETAHADLQRDADAPAILVGPPAYVLELARYTADRGAFRLGSKLTVVTMGGWKKRDNVKVSRDNLTREVCDAFGLRGPDQVRDAFNMVELNTVVLECGRHTKHIPPWLYVSACDVRTLGELPSGEVGILAYGDPTARSFPCYVLSDDFGSVVRDFACPCGITTDRLVIDRRINTLESRGCALKL